MWLLHEMIFNPLVMRRSLIISNQFTSTRCLLHCQHSISIKTHSSKATATYNRWVATRIPTKTTTACQNVRRQSTTTSWIQHQTRIRKNMKSKHLLVNTTSLTRTISKPCSFSRKHSRNLTKRFIMLVCIKLVLTKLKTTTQKQKKT